MKNVMHYGKARGMTLVGKYLPKLNPFQSIDLIGTMEQWKNGSKYATSMGTL